MTKVLSILFAADSKRLMRWIVKEKVDMLEYYFMKNMEIWIREHDDVPPDEDDFMTFDDKFYFRFPTSHEDADRGNSQELITKMLERVAEMDLSVFHGLMLETTFALGPEVEEEQYRLKNFRLAEKGFLPSYEAVGVYQPMSSLKLRKRVIRKSDRNKIYDPDIPAIPNYTSGLIKDDNLFVSTLQKLNADIFSDIQAEFGTIVNKVISADRIKIRAKKDIEKAIDNACAYLSVGIERVDTKNPVSVVEKYFLEDILRAGYSEILRLGRKVVAWHRRSFLEKNNLPLGFLDEKWLAVVGGLMLDRPLFYDGVSKGGTYRNFKSFKEVLDVTSEVENIIETDKILAKFDIDIKSFSKGILTYKSLLFTLWAKDHLAMGNSLSPIPVNTFKSFFADLFSNKKELKIENIKRKDFISWVTKISKIDMNEIPETFVSVANEMFDEIEEEYGTISVNDLDITMMRHFLLK